MPSGSPFSPSQPRSRSPARFDSKWLQTSLQFAFPSCGLCGLWNEMVRDGEIIHTDARSAQNGELSSRKDGSAECPSGTKK
uniref:Uncharacterized protein n=1 Tax=Ornithorhynchus anatinus TaxID=9258 RepID=A0A6I8PGB0_ORNAN